LQNKRVYEELQRTATEQKQTKKMQQSTTTVPNFDTLFKWYETVRVPRLLGEQQLPVQAPQIQTAAVVPSPASTAKREAIIQEYLDICKRSVAEDYSETWQLQCLEAAESNDAIKFINLVIEHGPNTIIEEVRDFGDCDAFQVACAMGSHRIVSEGYDHFIDFLEDYCDDNSYVHLSVMSGSLKTLAATRYYLRSSYEDWELSPLQLAIALGRFQMVKALYHSGYYAFDNGSCDDDGDDYNSGSSATSSSCQPIKGLVHLAASKGHLNILKYILVCQAGRACEEYYSKQVKMMKKQQKQLLELKGNDDVTMNDDSDNDDSDEDDEEDNDNEDDNDAYSTYILNSMLSESDSEHSIIYPISSTNAASSSSNSHQHNYLQYQQRIATSLYQHSGNYSPLLCAIENNHTSTSLFILSQYSINRFLNYDWAQVRMCVLVAISNSNYEILKELYEVFHDEIIKDPEFDSIVMGGEERCLKTGKYNEQEDLFCAGSSSNGGNYLHEIYMNMTPLIVACEFNDKNIIDLLLLENDNGSSSSSDPMYMTILPLEYEYKLLLEEEEEENGNSNGSGNGKKKTIMMKRTNAIVEACKYGHLDLVKRLVKYAFKREKKQVEQSEQEQQSKDKLVPLKFMDSKVKQVLQAMISSDNNDSSSATTELVSFVSPLYAAVDSGNVELVKYLITKPTRLNKEDGDDDNDGVENLDTGLGLEMMVPTTNSTYSTNNSSNKLLLKLLSFACLNNCDLIGDSSNDSSNGSYSDGSDKYLTMIQFIASLYTTNSSNYNNSNSDSLTNSTSSSSMINRLSDTIVAKLDRLYNLLQSSNLLQSEREIHVLQLVLVKVFYLQLGINTITVEQLATMHNKKKMKMKTMMNKKPIQKTGTATHGKEEDDNNEECPVAIKLLRNCLLQQQTMHRLVTVRGSSSNGSNGRGNVRFSDIVIETPDNSNGLSAAAAKNRKKRQRSYDNDDGMVLCASGSSSFSSSRSNSPLRDDDSPKRLHTL